MTDRDRLIELKIQAVNYAQEKADERGGLVCIDDEVDYLLANGVKLPIMCKDCKSCELRYPAKAIGEEAIKGYYCNIFKQYSKPNDYCSYGELKEREKVDR